MNDFDQEGPPPPVRDARFLGMIRMAFLGGPILFGVSTFFAHQDPEWTPQYMLTALRYAPAAALVVGLFTVVALRLYLGKFRDPTLRERFGIIAWASGEVPALWGGYYYWMTDDPRWLIAGTFVLLLSFVLFSLRTRE